MGFNKKCPKCNRQTVEHVDSERTSSEEGMRYWCYCKHCGHKWKELYELHLVKANLPWTKLPHPYE